MKSYFQRTRFVYLMLFLLCGILPYTFYRLGGGVFIDLDSAWSVYTIIICPILSSAVLVYNSCRLGRIDLYPLIAMELFLLLSFFAIAGFILPPPNELPYSVMLLLVSMPAIFTLFLGSGVSATVLAIRRHRGAV